MTSLFWRSTAIKSDKILSSGKFTEFVGSISLSALHFGAVTAKFT